ncbi:MAG TPA: YbaK/EbsC family protein [Bryobacteraceae bacterium]|nr:YbaK/EbsC family protein [Bryobacteraceae bacterium]
MTTLQRCLDFLDRAHISYAHTKHSLAFTALEVAFAEHISPHKLAKTVVYVGAQGYGFAVLPADCLIDMSILGVFVNDPAVRLASERELGELFPECELGAMPPFGNLFHLPVIVDVSIAEQEFIAFTAGTHRDVVHMHFGDFKRLVDPAVAKIALVAVEQALR